MLGVRLGTWPHEGLSCPGSAEASSGFPLAGKLFKQSQERAETAKHTATDSW